MAHSIFTSLGFTRLAQHPLRVFFLRYSLVTNVAAVLASALTPFARCKQAWAVARESGGDHGE